MEYVLVSVIKELEARKWSYYPKFLKLLLAFFYCLAVGKCSKSETQTVVVQDPEKGIQDSNLE